MFSFPDLMSRGNDLHTRSRSQILAHRPQGVVAKWSDTVGPGSIDTCWKSKSFIDVSDRFAMVQAAIGRKIYLHQLALPLGQLLDDSKPVEILELIPHFEELNTYSLLHNDILSPHGVRSIRAPCIDTWYWNVGKASRYNRSNVMRA